jgi:omega-hydroxy-beta-dihydromenaquinone-9 sulfotransferase
MMVMAAVQTESPATPYPPAPTSQSTQSQEESRTKAAAAREWMPRMWQGCNLAAWLRLLVRNKCAVAPPYWYIAAVVTNVSIVHSSLRVLQDAWFGDHANTPLRHAPLFIVGHWRTGTTLLHELLILDERHTFPNTYQCLAPHHFLLTETWLPRLLWWLMPEHRPMDNMAAGWDKPQEDEFALCMLGQPSPYLTIAFPNRPPQDQDAFDLEGLPKQVVARWKEAFLRFLRQLSYKDPRRLILKSPTHSCRIPTLVELFPDARFVHIVRDPYVVFPSTVNLWKSLYKTHGLQTPRFEGLEEYVFSTFTHLYERLEAGKQHIRPGRFHEVRYEDLVRDPLGEMGLLYERLELGGFERVRPRLVQYLEGHAGYKTNRYDALAPELQAEITRRWQKMIRQYGYERRD